MALGLIPEGRFTPSDLPPGLWEALAGTWGKGQVCAKFALKTPEDDVNTTRRDKMASRRLQDAFRGELGPNLDPSRAPKH